MVMRIGTNDMRYLARLMSWLVALGVPIVFVAPVVAAAEAPTVSVVMTEYDFAPKHLVLRHGVRYRLHLQNAGKEVHEFTAPAFFKIAQIENPDALDPDRKQVVLQPDETKDLLLTASRPGSYELRCADHDWAGMVGRIIVK
jgi:uncharacterized cupredoxin-like copper-binding protein